MLRLVAKASEAIRCDQVHTSGQAGLHGPYDKHYESERSASYAVFASVAVQCISISEPYYRDGKAVGTCRAYITKSSRRSYSAGTTKVARGNDSVVSTQDSGPEHAGLVEKDSNEQSIPRLECQCAWYGIDMCLPRRKCGAVPCSSFDAALQEPHHRSTRSPRFEECLYLGNADRARGRL